MTDSPAAPAGEQELLLWERELPELLRDGTPSGRTASEAAADRPDSPRPHIPPPLPPAPSSEDPATAARDIIAKARVEADDIICRARAEAGGVHEAARTSAAQAVALEQHAIGEEVLSLIRDDLTTQFGAKWGELELEAAGLCAELAEKIVRTRIEESDEVVLATVREGLAVLAGARSITIHASPECQAALEVAREALARSMPSEVSIELVPDKSVSPGGVLVRSDMGDIDLQIETQMARLREAAMAAIVAESARKDFSP